MIDTIILEVDLGDPKKQKIISRETFDQWSPSLEGVLSAPYRKLGAKGNIKCTNNCTSEEKAKRRYVPKLTVYKQVTSKGFKYQLYIEFSAPKILFNNNFEEVDEADLEELCTRLSGVLASKGITLSRNEIKRAKVRTIHYSKNIILKDGVTMHELISMAKKASISTRRRVSNEIYCERGEAIHVYNNTKGFCIYDKIGELEVAKKTEKGNIEQDSWCQFGIIAKLLSELGVTSLDVARLEYRLGDKANIRRAVEPIIGPKPRSTTAYTLEQLFQKKIAKKLLEQEFEMVASKLPEIVTNTESMESIIYRIHQLNPNIKTGQLISTIALYSIAREMPLRDAEKAIGAQPRAWKELLEKVRNVKYRIRTNRNPLEQISYQLDKFTSFKLGKKP